MSTEVPTEAMFLRVEDRVVVGVVGDGNPFRFAVRHVKGFADRYVAAGTPPYLTVAGLSRTPDEPSDITVAFDLGDGKEPFSLPFHRESVLSVLDSSVPAVTQVAGPVTSDDFITSSDFHFAWEALKERNGGGRLSGVRLERTVGRSGEWKTSATGSKTSLREYVRGLDGAPIPGRFRLAVG